MYLEYVLCLPLPPYSVPSITNSCALQLPVRLTSEGHGHKMSGKHGERPEYSFL